MEVEQLYRDFGKKFKELDTWSVYLITSIESFEKFPPISGEYALPDEIAYATEDSENHLTDYSLGKNGVYCAFSYNVEDEALEFVKSIADEYGVGIYNPQSSDAIFCTGIDILLIV